MPREREREGFKYRGRTAEDVSRRAKQSSGAYDNWSEGDTIPFKPKEGENCIRILPWISGENPDVEKYTEKWGNHWGIDLLIHYNVGPDNGSYLCLDKMKGERCPICQARHEATDEDEADKLKPSTRILCWVIDRNDEKSGPKLWSMPLGVSQDISASSTVKGSGEALLIDHPEEGYDVYFDREGEKLKTKYKRIDVARESSPIHDDQKIQQRWLDYVEENLLPNILVFYDAEHIEKVLFGQGEQRDAGDRDSDRGRSSGRRGRDELPAEDREETTTRGGRRGRDAEPEPKPEPEPERGRGRGRDREPEPEPEPERGRRGEQRTRGHSEREPEPEPGREEPRGRRGRGRDAEPEPEPERGGRTERYRGRGEAEGEAPAAEEGEDADRTVSAARGRLARVGRRGR